MAEVFRDTKQGKTCRGVEQDHITKWAGPAFKQVANGPRIVVRRTAFKRGERAGIEPCISGRDRQRPYLSIRDFADPGLTGNGDFIDPINATKDALIGGLRLFLEF